MDTPEERQAQARELRGYAKYELESLTHFTEKSCLSIPKLLTHREDAQGPQGFVPNGYALYLLMEKLPGRRLGENFWALSAQDRDEIRERFKGAWMHVLSQLLWSYAHTDLIRRDCLVTGLLPTLGTVNDMMWDPVSRRV